MAAYSVNEIIEMAVQIERNGYAFYDEAAKRKDLMTTAGSSSPGCGCRAGPRKDLLRLRDEVDNICPGTLQPIGTWWRLRRIIGKPHLQQ